MTTTTALQKIDSIQVPVDTTPIKRILAIDPGVKRTGYALLRGEQVITYGVIEGDKGKPGEQPLETVIFEFDPDELIIEWPASVGNTNPGSKANTLEKLFNVAKKLRSQALQRGIPVHQYSSATIRKWVAGFDASKRDTARLIALLYPELKVLLDQPTRAKERHWGHVFDAMAAAVCHFVKREEE